MRKEKQIRSAALDLKANDGEQMEIRGYFAVFDTETNLGGGVFEKIGRTAFNSSLHKDVRALTNHDTSLVLGRTTNNTLSLSVDERGLYGVIRINENDVDAVNLYQRVKRGDINQCSFGFLINEENIEFRDDGSTLFEVTDLDLYEVSVCTFPAYEATGVEARHAKVKEHKERKLAIWKKEMREKLNGN